MHSPQISPELLAFMGAERLTDECGARSVHIVVNEICVDILDAAILSLHVRENPSFSVYWLHGLAPREASGELWVVAHAFDLAVGQQELKRRNDP